MNFKIEKNIPISKRKYNKKGNKTGCISVYPFDNMVDGDSFFIPIPNSIYHVASHRVYAAARNRKIKIVTRYVEGGLRVWKIGVITNNKGELKQ